VRLHPNARTTPSARRLLVERVQEQGLTVAEASQQLGISRRTGYKWMSRYRQGGLEALRDRSSRPRRSPTRTSPKLIKKIQRLRREKKTAWEISSRLDIPASTVSRLLKQMGLGRLWKVEIQAEPPRRYEHAQAGGMVHIDAKKLGRIQGVGHRIHGDRRRRQRGVGWEVAFVAVDDRTRLAYSEVLPRENAKYATQFLRRALRWFGSLNVEIRRILTDNAKAYSSIPFRGLCDAEGIRQSFTRPYTPKTNGKAERFIQTLTRRWAYGQPYSSSAARSKALRPWINHYNHQRPHRGIGMRSPITRLREDRREQRP